jgi:tubulin monoglycylase TTLL3/8
VAELYSHFAHLVGVVLRARDHQHFSLSHHQSGSRGRGRGRGRGGMRNLWILKPGGLSRGRGIEVHHSYADIMSLLRKGGKYVAQKYIERPLLIRRKKFDVRQWVVLSNFSAVRSVWFYSEGCYLRFSSADFSAASLDPLIHLTNNSVQKTFENQFDTLDFMQAKGNMWSSEQFVTHLHAHLSELHRRIPGARTYPSGRELWKGMVQPAMQQIVRLTLSCAQDGLEYRSNSFTLLGFDFMFSHNDLRPWLIEVNSSPTLAGISVDGLVEQMSADLIELVTQDPWSPLSDEYRQRVEKEKQRIADEAAAAAAAAAEESAKIPGAATVSKKTAAAAPGASSSKPALEAKRSLQRNGSATASSNAPSSKAAGGSAVAQATTAAAAAAAAAASAGADPFILPVPHPVGHRVDGWEVIESSFIGTIPRSHRTPPLATTTAATAAAAAPASTAIAAAAIAATGDKEKKATAQPTGLFVTGKAIPLPGSAVALPIKSAAAAGRSAGSAASAKRRV